MSTTEKQAAADARRISAHEKVKAAALAELRKLHSHKLGRWTGQANPQAVKDAEKMFFDAVLRCHFSPQQLPAVMALAYEAENGMPTVLRYGIEVGLLTSKGLSPAEEAQP